MILITKEEYEAIVKKFGDKTPHVAITNRNKKGSRKKRYIEESRPVMKYIKELRSHTNKEAKT